MISTDASNSITINSSRFTMDIYIFTKLLQSVTLKLMVKLLTTNISTDLVSLGYLSTLFPTAASTCTDERPVLSVIHQRKTVIIYVLD